MALQIEKGQNSTSECKQKNIDEDVIEKMVMGWFSTLGHLL